MHVIMHISLGCLSHITFRGSFIIDDKGVVRHFSQNDNSVGRNVAEALRLVQGYLYSDAHPGEVCPINWVPGASSVCFLFTFPYTFFFPAFISFLASII